MSHKAKPEMAIDKSTEQPAEFQHKKFDKPTVEKAPVEQVPVEEPKVKSERDTIFHMPSPPGS